jgi:hypothetical protein
MRGETFTKLSVQIDAKKGRPSNAVVSRIYFFLLTEYTADIKMVEMNMSIRIRIPAKPLKIGARINRHNIEMSRKRNLPLKKACVNVLKIFLTIFKLTYQDIKISYQFWIGKRLG